MTREYLLDQRPNNRSMQDHIPFTNQWGFTG